MTNALGNARSFRQVLFDRTKRCLGVHNQWLLNVQRFLCALAKLQKTTISFIVVSVRLSVLTSVRMK